MQCPESHGLLVLLPAWALRKTSFHFPLVSLCVLSFKHQFQEKKLSLTSHFSRHEWGMHDKVHGRARNKSAYEQTPQKQALRKSIIIILHITIHLKNI